MYTTIRLFLRNTDNTLLPLISYESYENALIDFNYTDGAYEAARTIRTTDANGAIVACCTDRGTLRVSDNTFQFVPTVPQGSKHAYDRI